MTRQVRVAVNGYGVIGKRVADAVRLQPDMDLVGVADVVSDWRAAVAAEKGLPIYAGTPDAATALRSHGFEVAGDVPALVAASEVIVDCTPQHVAAGKPPLFEPLDHGIR